MTTYKLTYFDFDGGRGEPARIAFHAAGIEFEDNRISFPEFNEMRQGTRFNSVPVLEIDGIEVSQSNAMNRFIGKMAGLYPSNELQALYCDEVMDALEDLTHYIVPTMGKEGDELKQARKKLVDGWMTVYIKGLDSLLARGGGEYFADNRLTVADIRAMVQVRSLRKGTLDHVPVDLVDRLAPALAAHQQRIEAEPQVAAYYASRQ
ncbi:MAG: glutathione S-transferase family protein [Gammaproteobacteria bacterium]|nr:glutathione S-transferase family protein [Gammaproteobacteria bacterium]